MHDVRVGSAKRSLRALVIIVIVAVPMMTGCASKSSSEPKNTATSFVLAGVSHVQQISQITGFTSPNHTSRYDVAGQDLGSMFEADGKTWFVFGDTFGQRDAGMSGGGGTQWRSNALAYSTDTDPSNGITLDGYIADPAGAAKELVPSQKIDNKEMTAIPTYGFEANGAMYLDYMSVKHWGDPGKWTTNYSGLAKSVDHGQTWTVLPAPRWSGNSNFIQVSVRKIGNDLYFWGVTHGRFGGVQLMRVPEKSVEKKGAYEYFTGTSSSGSPTWSPQIGQAKTIVGGTVGELSVVWNTYLHRWLMTDTDGGNGSTQIHEGIHPWGPWSPGTTLLSAKAVPGLYAPFMSEHFVANGGRTIYFTLSKWGPYNVFWYRADLVKTD